MAASISGRRASSKRYLINKYGPEEGLQRWEKKWAGNLGRYKPAGDSPLPEPDAPMDLDPGELKPQRTGERAPSRKKPSRAEMQLMMGAGIYYVDAGVAWFYPPWQQDRLSEREIGMLSKALATEVLDSPRLLAWAVRAQKSVKHGELLKAVILIALPRMAKHGMLPSGLSGQEQSQQPDAGGGEQSTVPVEGGPTYGGDRDDGVGQVSPDSAIAGLSPLFRGAEEQGGFGQIPGGADGQDSGGDARPADVSAGTAA